MSESGLSKYIEALLDKIELDIKQRICMSEYAMEFDTLEARIKEMKTTKTRIAKDLNINRSTLNKYLPYSIVIGDEVFLKLGEISNDGEGLQ